MEQLMRCNVIKCRRELEQQAVVTTCSHIYCIDCANATELVKGPSAGRICPACRAPLNNLDDVVVTNLQPTEDYKTSVLSGLSPNIVMECAGKALSFWAYQMTQEIVYQAHLYRSLTDKYSNMSRHLDKVINEANSQINGLQQKIASMSLDQESLQRKNDEVVFALKDKSKKLLRVQELYDKLKRKAMLGQIQDAASDIVSSNIEAAQSHGATLAEHLGQPGLYERQHQFTSAPYDKTHDGHETCQDRLTTAPVTTGRTGGWQNPPMQSFYNTPSVSTPDTYRFVGGNVPHTGLDNHPGVVSGTPRVPGSGRMRQPVFGGPARALNPAGQPAVGFHAGMKSGHVAGTGTAFAYAGARPKVVQRPIPEHGLSSQRHGTQFVSQVAESGGLLGQ